MKVFVVDDDAAVRESLGRALRLEGPQLLLERLHPAQVGGGLKGT